MHSTLNPGRLNTKEVLAHPPKDTQARDLLTFNPLGSGSRQMLRPAGSDLVEERQELRHG